MNPWFEKELAEADILKFPEPKGKVIRMPNVQEYPDFITGVSDLQAKQKDGTISQESYNKLYAELIHRFMKKESFETPWYLREDTRKLRQGSSRGVYNEIILAIAIFSKFKNNGADISEQDIYKGLTKLSDTPIGFQGKNREGDIIQCVIGDKGPKITKDLKDTKNIELMDQEILGNKLFVNADITAEKLSTLYATNEKPDNVVVKQMGGERSKVDVLLGYQQPDKTVKKVKGYSAKTFSNRLDNKDVNTMEAVSEYFKPFGVNIDVTKYAEIDRKVSGTKLFTDVFKEVTEFGKKLLGQDNENSERTFINALMRFAKTAMTGGEEDFLMVEITNSDFTAHDFQVLINNLDKIDLDIALRTYEKSKQPMITIFDKKSDELLIMLRYSYSAPRISKSSGKLGGRNRIFVESGSLFKRLSKVDYNKPTQQKTQPTTTPTTPGAKPQTAPQQKLSTGNDGQRYRNYGAQWINDVTGRIATRDVAAYLDQNKHLQTPVS
jgi:hypothetical protein